MAAATDKFKKLTNNFSTTLTASIIGGSDSSMSLASVTNLPTDTGTVFVIDRINAAGTSTPATREYVCGTVSGLTVINLRRGLGGSTAQAHSTGAIVEQVTDQVTINELMDGLLVQHNQDGTHNTTYVVTPSATQTVTNKTLDQTNTVNARALTNPYKFFAYRNAAWTATNTAIVFDTKVFDTGNNLSTTTGLFTAPVTGFYFLVAQISVSWTTSSGKAVGPAFVKNGTTTIARGLFVGNYTGAWGDWALQVCWFGQLTANDTIAVVDQGNSSLAGNVGQTETFFQGFLQSTT